MFFDFPLQNEAELTDLDEAFGFSHVIAKISHSKKLVVGNLIQFYSIIRIYFRYYTNTLPVPTGIHILPYIKNHFLGNLSS